MVNGAARGIARFWVAVLTLLTIFGEASAWAKDATATPTLVIGVEGAPDDKLRTALGTGLPAPWAAAELEAVGAAAQNRKVPPSASALRDRKGRGPYVQKLAQVATDVGAKAAVIVQIQKGKKRVAHVVLISATGPVLADSQVSLTVPEEDAAIITRAFARELATLLPSAEPTPPSTPASVPTVAGPSVDAPKPGAPPAVASDTPPAAPAGAPVEAAPWIVATATMELANRHLSYSDVTTSNIHSDDSGIVPMPAVAVDVFPFAPGGTPYLKDLGLFGDFKLGLAARKTLSDGTKAPVTWTRFDAGLKYRIWIKRIPKAPVLALSLSYGQESYVFHPPSAPAEPLDTPSAAYQIVRPRIEARLPAGPVAVLLGGGYLAVLNSVEFAGKFRDASVYGWEADLALAVPIGNVVELRGGVAYRRIVHIFGPEKGDPYIASVADDQILRADLGISARF